MKKIILLLITFFVVSSLHALTHVPDTSVIYKNKRIQIKAGESQTKISVYENNSGDEVRKVYEAVYSDDKQVERSFITSGFQKLPLLNIDKPS